MLEVFMVTFLLMPVGNYKGLGYKYWILVRTKNLTSLRHGDKVKRKAWSMRSNNGGRAGRRILLLTNKRDPTTLGQL